jgi:hypothetical protein
MVSLAFKFDKAVNGSRASPAMLTGAAASFHILHRKPTDPLEAAWRACLANSDFPTHYTAPEYFCEPMLHGKGPFAVLSAVDDRVTGDYDRASFRRPSSIGAVYPSADRFFARRRSNRFNG